MAYIENIGAADFYIEREVVKAPLHTMHYHRSYELYYLVKGAREYFIEDRFFLVKEGDVVLIPKKVFHRTAGEGGLRFLVHFSDSFLHKYFTDTLLQPLLEGIPFVFRGENRERERILSLLNTLLAEYNRNDPQKEPLLSGYLYQLLFTLANANNTYVPHNRPDERITRLIQYINENYNHITDIEQIAQHFYISKYHLCRFFRKNLGIPLVSYVNTIKVREACAQMKSGHTSMTQIAMQCGFNSSSYFCKVFKKETGISPSEYRKKHKYTKAPPA